MGKELRDQQRGAIVGRPRVLPDGRIGKFGWKAQFATLEEFVAAACANEIGLGNPLAKQANPLTRSDAPKAKLDLDAGQFLALVSYVDTLPRPHEVPPTGSDEQKLAGRGKALFGRIGCADCHSPDLGGVKGVYSDLLLHRLDDRSLGGMGYGNPRDTRPVPLPENHPDTDEWRTPPLWGVADSAPYFHDGGSPTLEAAILRHLGDAFDVTEEYRSLSPRDQSAVLHFLMTLKAPPMSKPDGTASPSSFALAR
jgi:CxxC motif-containing protein (DUF1111 family)